MSSIYKLLEQFTEEYLEPACSNLVEFGVECTQFIGGVLLICALFITAPIWYIPFTIYKSKHK